MLQTAEVFAPAIPRVRARGRWWSRDEIEAAATRWRAEILDAVGDRNTTPAAVVPNSPDGVALIAALTSLPVPAIVLAPDPIVWKTDPPLPTGTTLALPPALAHLAGAATSFGCVPLLLSDRGESHEPLTLFQSPGIVLFTSGSTGHPKAVLRSLAGARADSTARTESLGFQRGDGVITGASLAHGHGMNRALLSMFLGGPFGLVDPLDHRDALAAFASSEFALWSTSAHFASVMTRSELHGPATVPRICLVASAISRSLFDAFRERFGVPLRQNYSSTETGAIAMDVGPAADVQPETVGRPLPGVEIHLGDHPGASAPPDESGRIWVRSPWRMVGYGFPPKVERPGEVDGWWPTADVGRWNPDGRLVLEGRVDDCVRTRQGRLVNLAIVAAGLREVSGARDVVVLPLHGASGTSIGAVLECEAGVTLEQLRQEMSVKFPEWARPRSLLIVQSLPRLPNGKPDRRSCAALLQQKA